MAKTKNQLGYIAPHWAGTEAEFLRSAPVGTVTILKLKNCPEENGKIQRNIFARASAFGGGIVSVKSAQAIEEGLIVTFLTVTKIAEATKNLETKKRGRKSKCKQ